MRFSLSILAAALAAFAAVPAVAEEEFPDEVAARDSAMRLQPMSAWNLDFGESRCRLARLFGTESEPYALFIEQPAPSKWFSLTLAGSELKRFQRAKALELGLERDEPMQRSEAFVAASLGRFGPSIILGGVNLNDAPASEASDSDIQIRKQMSLEQIDTAKAELINRFILKRGSRIVSFETGNMKAPLDALNQCSLSFISAWGLDPDEHEKFTPVRWTNQQSVVQTMAEGYSREAIRKGEQGIFRLRVIVEPDGRVSECQLNNATITESLQSTACKAMTDAVFEPALNAKGEPMRSFYATRLNYRIGVGGFCPGNTRIC